MGWGDKTSRNGGRGGCLPPKSEVENMTSSFLDMRRHRKNEQAGASICRFFPCIWWTVDFVCYPGVGWQECAEAIPGQQLPEHNTSEALHLHHAHAAGWWLEPDPVQLVGLHTPRLRYQLHRDPPSPGKDTVEFLCMVLFDLLNTKFFSEETLAGTEILWGRDVGQKDFLVGLGTGALGKEGWNSWRILEWVSISFD